LVGKATKRGRLKVGAQCSYLSFEARSIIILGGALGSIFEGFSLGTN
jgi:hypothetical protein